MFLIHCYAVILLFFIAHTVFAGIPRAELGLPFAYNVLRFCVAVISALSIATAVGLHRREAWAAVVSRFLCLGLIAFIIFLGAWIYIQYESMGMFRSPLDHLLGFYLPAVMLAQIPVYYAWGRYFKDSPRLKAALGVPSVPSAVLPPLSIALLKILCSIVIIIAIMSTLLPVLAMDTPAYTLLLVNLSMPLLNAVFAAIILASVNMRKRGVTYWFIGIWIILLSVSAHANTSFFYFIVLDIGSSMANLGIYQEAINLLGLSAGMLVYIIAALWWRLDSTDDSEWFGPTKPDAAKTNYTALLILAWMVSIILPEVGYSFTEHTLNVNAADSGLHVRLLNGAAFAAAVFLPSYAAWLWSKRKSNADIVSMVAVGLYLAYKGVAIAAHIYELPNVPSDYRLRILSTLSCRTLLQIALLVLGFRYFLRRWRERAAIAASSPGGSIPLPLRVLQFFCLFILADIANYTLYPFFTQLILSEEALNEYYLNSFSPLPSLRYILLGIVTVMIILAIRRRRGQSLYVLLSAQAFILLAISVSMYLGAFIGLRYDAQMMTSFISVPILRFSLKILMFFWCYLYCSGQSKKWLFPPEGSLWPANATPVTAGQ